MKNAVLKDRFFFHTVYGNEGSLCTTVLATAVILFLIWRKTKKMSPETNIQTGRPPED